MYKGVDFLDSFDEYVDYYKDFFNSLFLNKRNSYCTFDFIL